MKSSYITLGLVTDPTTMDLQPAPMQGSQPADNTAQTAHYALCGAPGHYRSHPTLGADLPSMPAAPGMEAMWRQDALLALRQAGIQADTLQLTEGGQLQITIY